MRASFPFLYSYLFAQYPAFFRGELPSDRKAYPVEEKKTDSSLDALVRVEKLQLLFHQSYPAIFVSLISCALLSAILWPVQHEDVLFPWILIIAVNAFARFILFTLYNYIKPRGRDILAWEGSYFITLLLSSLSWGIGALFIMPFDSQLHQVVVFYFLIGMSGGALSVYSANRVMTLTAIACLLIPITTWFILQSSLLPVAVGMGAVVFYISAIRAGRILSSTLNDSFKLGHELKIAKETAEAMAQIDELSGINNRRAFYDKGKMLVDYCLRNNEELSAIIFDIDHFKKINDRLGHAAGDAAIRHLGQILQQTIRKSDLCARIGGEEFVVLLKPYAPDEAAKLAEILRLMISKAPIRFNGEEIDISASFGVAVGASDLDTLLKDADAAMYKAKEMGRNTVVCSE